MMQTELERLKRERYELTIALDRCIRAKNIALMHETKSKIRIVDQKIQDIESVDAIKLDDVNNKHLKSWFVNHCHYQLIAMTWVHTI